MLTSNAARDIFYLMFQDRKDIPAVNWGVYLVPDVADLKLVFRDHASCNPYKWKMWIQEFNKHQAEPIEYSDPIEKLVMPEKEPHETFLIEPIKGETWEDYLARLDTMHSELLAACHIKITSDREQAVRLRKELRDGSPHRYAEFVDLTVTI